MSLVSIIIPTWNAEEYLRACLRSVEAQTHADLQVLIVDDESSDASPYIANQFAEADSRFQYVWQQNRGPGPGGGRNGGLPFVEGDWIFFLDADDLLPPEAIEVLVATGNRTGSDIVSGHVSRFRSGGHAWPTPNHAICHQSNRDRTHILDYPVLAYDTTAWNKLYRTEFWNGQGRSFPERKLFEDIDPITRAQCESSSTDIVTDCVYLWRVRDDNTSITQQTADPRTFSDKVEQMTLAHAYLCDHGYTNVRRVFEEKSLTRDFAQGVDEVPHGDDEYLKVVCTAGADFLDRMLPESIEALPTGQRLKFHLVREGRVDDLRDVTTGGYDNSSKTIRPADAAAPAVVNDFAAALDPPVPAELTESDGWPPLTLSRVFLDWADDGHLLITAAASIRGLAGPLGRLDRVYVRCRRPDEQFDVEAEILGFSGFGPSMVLNSMQVDRSVRRAWFVPYGRFCARVALADLSLPDGVDGVAWRFSVGAVARQIERRTPLPALNDARLPAEREQMVDDLIYTLSVAQQMELEVRRAPWA